MQSDTELAQAICRKWVDRLGLGFHPDTRGNDYSPALSAAAVAEYESDIAALFDLDIDPYAIGLEAMEELISWHEFVANAAATAPHKRTQAQRDALAKAMKESE